jgi:predicted phage-related endonuclease
MLTKEQIDKRRGRMTASRVSALMTGDKEKIMRLYREMIGEEVEEDLSNVWPVQLGSATEQLNLDWFQKKNGLLVTRRGEVVVHPQHDWAAATLDGWVEDAS